MSSPLPVNCLTPGPHPRVIFVDDDEMVLAATRNLLRRKRTEWEIAFAKGGADALRQLEARTFDVVVCDLRMPGMDGAEVLAKVKERWPATLRLVLTAGSDDALVMRTLSVAHQFLSKPCEAEVLVETVERTLGLHRLLADDGMRALAGQLDTLPSVPQCYLELSRAASSPRTSVSDLAQIVERDPAMAAKVLQLVNSAYFGLPQRISSIQQAVSYLGLELLKGLALTAHIFSASVPRVRGFSLDRLQEHALFTARLAKRFLSGKQAETAFTAGLMHDVGRLVFALAVPERFEKVLDEVQRSGRSAPEVERGVLGVTHEQTGAYLLGSWGLPFSIVEAVAFHHHPSAVEGSQCPELAAVYVADRFSDALREKRPLPKDAELDGLFLSRVGVTARLPEWRRIAESCG